MLGFVLVITACALWAVDTLIRYPLIYSGVSAFSIVFYEHLILSVIFLVLFFKSIPNLKKLDKKRLPYFFVVGGLGSALATLAFTKAFSFLNPSLVILLQKFQPVVAIILAKFILKEQVGKSFLIWAFVCLIGALLISFQDIQTIYEAYLNNTLKNPLNSDSLKGYLCVAFAVCGWGASTVYGKKLSLLGHQNEQIMAGRFILGFICLLPFVPFNKDIFSHNVEVYGNVSLMVVLSGLLAMYVYYHGLRRISARACSLTEMFFPFMAIIVNWIFLDAKLTLIQLTGGVILLLGSVIIQLKRY